MRAAVEVHAVAVHRGHVEAADSPAYSLAIVGTVPGAAERPRVEARAAGEPIGAAEPAADGSFTLIVDTLELAPRFTLELTAGGTPLATVTGERPVLPPAPPGNIEPLLMPVMGRSGSSWLVRLLGEHPSIVAHRSFELEPRAVFYWGNILTELSNPAGHWQLMAMNGTPRWWFGDGATPDHLRWVDPELRAEIGRDAVDELCAFAHRRVERFYRAAARIAGVDDPRAFVEKTGHGWRVQRLIAELWPRSRDIVLVRDFRDIVASVLAFNEKRGYVAFGRQRFDTDEEFLVFVRDYASGLRDWYRGRGERGRLVRYEDLILEPDRTLSGILDWLGLDASPAVVAATIASASQETPQMRAHRTAPSVRESIGRWRSDLSPELRERSTETFAELLADFGYEV